jgi:hypothetical protein
MHTICQQWKIREMAAQDDGVRVVLSRPAGKNVIKGFVYGNAENYCKESPYGVGHFKSATLKKSSGGHS